MEQKSPQTSADLQRTQRTLLPFTLTHPWLLRVTELAVFLPCIYHSVNVCFCTTLLQTPSGINNAVPHLHNAAPRMCKTSWSMWQVGSELTPPKLHVPRIGYFTASSNEHQHLPILGEIWKILFTLRKQTPIQRNGVTDHCLKTNFKIKEIDESKPYKWTQVRGTTERWFRDSLHVGHCSKHGETSLHNLTCSTAHTEDNYLIFVDEFH